MVSVWEWFPWVSQDINVKVFSGTVTGIVRIQTSGAIWVGRVVAEALHTCNEHFAVISIVLFAYKVVGLLRVEKV